MNMSERDHPYLLNSFYRFSIYLNIRHAKLSHCGDFNNANKIRIDYLFLNIISLCIKSRQKILKGNNLPEIHINNVYK